MTNIYVSQMVVTRACGHRVIIILVAVIEYNFQNYAFTKIDHSDRNSPHRELSNGGLKSVATLLVRQQINFSCADI